jgi:UV excision repair protein RAD23
LAQQQQQGGVPGPRTQPDLEALQNHPEIQLLQQRIAQNPAGLQTLIQEFANRHPAMAQLLAAHPEVLLRGIEHDDGDGDGSIPPGTQVVNVTGEERAAIERVSIFYHS